MLNGRPLYRKNGMEHLYLAYTNISGYPVPWTMWGSKWLLLNQPWVGNIKMGPDSLWCPENNTVRARLLDMLLIK